ncbi:MAG: amino acid adenylation domain-containing protein [Chloroflexota bacterium]
MINQTAYTQPALFAIEYALAKLWQSWAIQPDFVLGHSVGEYAAACIAGVFSLEDGLKLIAARGRLMQALPAGGVMTAVFAPESTIAPLVAPLANEVSIATINGAKNVVIAGTQTAVSTITEQLTAQGIRTRSLTVSHAFHSPLMEPMLNEFTAVAEQISYAVPQIPLVSNVTGQILTEAPDADYWRQHVRQAVRFADGIATLAAQNIDVYLEIGPQATLIGMGRRCLPKGAKATWLPSLSRKQGNWQTILTSLGTLYELGADVDWDGFEQDYQRQIVSLPTYAFDRQRYWLDVEPTERQVMTRPTNSRLRKLETAVPIYEITTTKSLSNILNEVAQAHFGSGNHQINVGETSADLPTGQATVQIMLTPAENGAAYQLFVQASVDEAWVPVSTGNLIRGEASAEPEPEILNREKLLATDENGRLALATTFLQAEAAAVLGLPANRLKPQQPLDTVGMDSLMAIELKNKVEKQLEVSIPIVAFLEGPSVAQLAEKLVDYLETAVAVEPIPITAANHTNHPLSQSQQAMWFLHQLLPNNVSFNVSGAVRVHGSFDVAALETSFQQLINRHPSLRTTFHLNREAYPEQAVHETLALPFSFIEGFEWDNTELQDYLEQEAHRPFDLAKGPLLRLVVVQRATNEHIILLSVNHIVTDFWSMSLLVSELYWLYEAIRDGKAAVLPELTHQYADFARWQETMLAGERGEELRDYWLAQLAGDLPRLDLPTDRSRPARPTYTGKTLTHRFAPELAAQFKQLCQEQGVTLYTGLLAAFQTLLHRYARQDDVIVGSVLAGRDRAELANLVGYFVSPVAMRANFSEASDFATLLTQVKETVLGAFAHQEYPLPLLAMDLQQTGQIKMDPSRPPLFDTMFIMQQAQVDDSLTALALGLPNAQVALGETKIEIQHLDGLPAQFDLTLMMADVDETLAASLHYATALFNETTMERLLAHLELLLSGVVAEPKRPLSQIPLLTSAERTVLDQLNDTTMAYPDTLCLHEIIEQQIAKTPNAPAVTFNGETLTYAELNNRANQLAHYLQAQGTTTGSLIGLCVERSLNMMIGLLGILKAGGTYIPLDPNFPTARLTLMLNDAQPLLVLTETAVSPTVERNIPRHALDEMQLDQYTTTPISTTPIPNHHPAYIIYTSGSTGRPKGVAVTHRNVVNFLSTMQQEPGLIASDKLVAVTTLSFDIAALELYLPLTVGAEVVIASQETAVDGYALANLIEQTNASVVQATPATWQMLLETGWKGKADLKILCGGEALPRQLADNLLERCRELWNMYGPTETTIWSTCCQVFADNRPITIGKPIGNTQIYVLDGEMQPVPLGSVGDLYIGGDGVAQGYWQRSDLTAERFVEVDFVQNRTTGSYPPHNLENGRLYKTGDLARITANGDIIFLGRNDFQVKIRGYRIELGDIEAALEKEAAINQAIVIAREDTPQQKRLVAYYTLAADAKNPSPSDLRAALQTTLPDYMLPALFVKMDGWPLTPNSKIDRKALPAPTVTRAALGSYVAPRDDIETQLAELCASLVGVDKVGIHDSFFDLGGNSLLATQLVFQVRQRFQVPIPLRQVFREPTVAGLARAIKYGKADPLTIDAEEVKDMMADSQLDPAIHVNGQGPANLTAPKHILLTGATGFLGAYLVRDLLEATNATVHCLVRADNEAKGKQRLIDNMINYHTWDDSLAERIGVIVGHLNQPRFGLSEAEFDELADKMDVLYHNGAMVNMVYSYHAHKGANVDGTAEIIRLASLKRIKPIHFISTLAIFNRMDQTQTFHEGQRADTLEVPMGGYAQSKWVAERLIQDASDRGLPVAIYRPGVISGDSQSGFANSDDMVSLLAQACIKLNIVPELDVKVNIIPVDFTSKAIAHIAQKPDAFGKVYHLANWEPMPYVDLIGWANSHGYNFNPIPFADWRDKLMELAPTLDDMSGWVPALPLIEEAGESQVFMPEFSCQNTMDGLSDIELRCPPVGVELISTYMAYYGHKVI